MQNGLTLADFTGDWMLEREIDDLRAGQRLRFDGRATFTPKGDHVLYSETGQLQLPGAAPMTATRRYLWHPDCARIDVRFDDGRVFHSFVLSGPSAEADHWCDPDQYAVTYDFSAWPVWNSRWRVTGPRKSYVMDSRYCRAGPCA